MSLNLGSDSGNEFLPCRRGAWALLNARIQLWHTKYDRGSNRSLILLFHLTVLAALCLLHLLNSHRANNRHFLGQQRGCALLLFHQRNKRTPVLRDLVKILTWSFQPSHKCIRYAGGLLDVTIISYRPLHFPHCHSLPSHQFHRLPVRSYYSLLLSLLADPSHPVVSWQIFSSLSCAFSSWVRHLFIANQVNKTKYHWTTNLIVFMDFITFKGPFSVDKNKNCQNAWASNELNKRNLYIYTRSKYSSMLKGNNLNKRIKNAMITGTVHSFV